MEFELKQYFTIESARFLSQLPAHHPCSQMHGHSFRITLRIIGKKNPTIGWVIDYNDIEKNVRPILNTIDHKCLNNVEGLENPTSENLCFWLFEKIKKSLPELVQITVAGTPSTECSYPAKI